MKVIWKSIFYKLETYTLDPNHPKGSDKAKWFSKALGFTLYNVAELVKQISFDQDKAIPLRVNQFGQMQLQYTTIHGTNNRIIKGVRTFWIKESKTGFVYFTNILPTKLKVLK